LTLNTVSLLVSSYLGCYQAETPPIPLFRLSKPALCWQIAEMRRLSELYIIGRSRLPGRLRIPYSIHSEDIISLRCA
jgi:hypothetical protein